ncbi:MAG: hypothetical protein G01um101413_441 [Parcubacteria group bacterium Gr01-1014_13]|nr:MAG: hypothetical protein G01um101413_441 [Parcubacteria group bacterium Gr01-1014_13]
MDKNGWIVIACLGVFILLGIIMAKLAKWKPSGGGLIKPETETEKAVLSDELKNRSAVDAVLPPPSLISFEKAKEVAKNIAPIFQGQDWFAGMGVMPDQKYGCIVQLRVFADAFKLTAAQFKYFPDSKEVDGIQVRLYIMEGRPVALGEKVYQVADKLAEVFEGRSWVTYIGPIRHDKYPNAVCLGFDPEVLQLKVDDFQYFPFTSTVDGVQVCLMPLERAVAQAEGAIKEKEE